MFLQWLFLEIVKLRLKILTIRSLVFLDRVLFFSICFPMEVCFSFFLIVKKYCILYVATYEQAIIDT